MDVLVGKALQGKRVIDDLYRNFKIPVDKSDLKKVIVRVMTAEKSDD